MTNYDALLEEIKKLGMDKKWSKMFVKKLADDERAFKMSDDEKSGRWKEDFIRVEYIFMD